jgi:hypothetical protein
MKENTEKKATCCHKCGRVHVKGTACKRPYLTGKDSCAVNEVQDLKEFFSKPLEEAELKLGVKYELPNGDTGYITTGGSNDSKDWIFSGGSKKIPYLSVKSKLKPLATQPGKYDGAFDLGLGKGHHIDESKEDMINRIMREVKNKKPGLWANINAKRARGEKPSHGNSKAFKDAVKAGKKINKTKK